MMRTVQVAVTDTGYANSLKEALSHSAPWHIEFVDRPNLESPSVLVLDEHALDGLSLPLVHPQRVVLITRQDPQLLTHAWDAGIVSVVSPDDSLPTVLLAIMAAALRVPQAHETPVTGEISPNVPAIPARISPQNQISRSRRCRTP